MRDRYLNLYVDGYVAITLFVQLCLHTFTLQHMKAFFLGILHFIRFDSWERLDRKSRIVGEWHRKMLYERLVHRSAQPYSGTHCISWLEQVLVRIKVKWSPNCKLLINFRLKKMLQIKKKNDTTTVRGGLMCRRSGTVNTLVWDNSTVRRCTGFKLIP